MVNGSFVFSMDDDGPDVFDRTIDWAVSNGIETATFHILTPYPGTGLYQRMEAEGRILHKQWDLFDTRHAVYQPTHMTTDQLETGYWKAYKEFYTWPNLVKSAMTHESAADKARHFVYSSAWKKFEPLWDAIIRARRASSMLPALEQVLGGFGARKNHQTKLPKYAASRESGHIALNAKN
jgi:radical SAM superfamily enzyme YgiQ (UPF0313 family)